MKQLPLINSDLFNVFKDEKIETQKMNYLKGGDGDGDGDITPPDPNPITP